MIRYRAGFKYQLAQAYIHQLPAVFRSRIEADLGFVALDLDGRLTFRAGYAWDGPSGPSVDTKTFMRGSLVHDGLYQLMREGGLSRELKDEADRELQRVCIEDGMTRLRAWYVYQGVARFGAPSTIRNKDILVAP